LAVIATLPFLIQQFTNLQIQFGGTALLIAVGVALDTMKQIESQMVMRNYRGFL
jgi:preprotein translocase subunit SecY